MLINKVKNALQKRKVKIFLVFFLCSSLAWFVSKLSESYTGRAVFDLEYKNVPDSLLFVGASKQNIEVKLSASGFAFLGFSFNNKAILIDVSKIEENDGQYLVTKNIYQQQIENQLPQSMELLSMYDAEPISLELYVLDSKVIPVKSKLKVGLGQNFMLDSVVEIAPDSIIVRGPKKELSKIKSVATEERELKGVTADFSEDLNLVFLEDFKNISYSNKIVNVHAKVVRFSEKVMTVPVRVLNLPNDYEIKIFPTTVDVLCKAKIDDLKVLSLSEFELVADYNSRNEEAGKTTIPVVLKTAPESLFVSRLMEEEVTYVLKRKE
ncbi:hypothetical protein KO500_06315 [Cellulophaga baltica]|uniref:hypothetical protein n=1 Tax=Cellulophaga TaxID=104264 RepID=UPI001C06B9EA|nr:MULTISPECIES: hypothetical protein [Cellulophaga]MBU2996038.1 hypothetical protein [Cellulophaga baltica]MDO6767433.1 hypothetical protein [Cellulophaga sp. 1_MG-2023]